MSYSWYGGGTHEITIMIVIKYSVPLVLPPVLVPRNPQVITSVYEPIPDSGRSANDDVNSLNFDTPGK